MRQQNKRLTPFGRLVSKALIDRDMTRRALASMYRFPDRVPFRM